MHVWITAPVREPTWLPGHFRLIEAEWSQENLRSGILPPEAVRRHRTSGRGSPPMRHWKTTELPTTAVWFWGPRMRNGRTETEKKINIVWQEIFVKRDIADLGHSARYVRYITLHIKKGLSANRLLTMHFKKSGGRLPGANHILDHTLVASVVRLAGFLDGQIATVDNANPLVPDKIQGLAVLAPRDLRLRRSSGGTAFHQGHLALGHAGICRLQTEFVAENWWRKMGKMTARLTSGTGKRPE